MQTLIYTLHFLACFVLIVVVLLQSGKGADLGASLGGGGANTIFGSRGAGNFLTKITTASAITFMGTSLTLSYLGYQSSDVRLFDPNAPIESPAAPAGSSVEQPEPGGLEEIPMNGDEAPGGLIEIPSGGSDVPAGASAESTGPES